MGAGAGGIDTTAGAAGGSGAGVWANASPAASVIAAAAAKRYFMGRRLLGARWPMAERAL